MPGTIGAGGPLGAIGAFVPQRMRRFSFTPYVTISADVCRDCRHVHLRADVVKLTALTE